MHMKKGEKSYQSIMFINAEKKNEEEITLTF